jgi:hypothetical protein
VREDAARCSSVVCPTSRRDAARDQGPDADILTGADARLGAGSDRYAFTAVDLHLLFLAGFTGAPRWLPYAPARAAKVIGAGNPTVSRIRAAMA